MSLEDALRSKVNGRIIRFLWKVGSSNLANLARKTNAKCSQLIPQLLSLERAGLVSEKGFGRVRMMPLEGEDSKRLLAVRALKILYESFTSKQESMSTKTDHAGFGAKLSSSEGNGND